MWRSGERGRRPRRARPGEPALVAGCPDSPASSEVVGDEGFEPSTPSLSSCGPKFEKPEAATDYSGDASEYCRRCCCDSDENRGLDALNRLDESVRERVFAHVAALASMSPKQRNAIPGLTEVIG
jgi:hypothetical protein